MVTDMVSYEILRGPEAAPDKSTFEKWFTARGNRIQTIETTYGAMWKELPAAAKQKIKRLNPDAGELSIREFAEKLEHVITEDAQVLVLFEEDAVKRMHFGRHVHLLHTFAFMLSLENLGVIASAEDMYKDVLAKGRRIARDAFERRATHASGSTADWQRDYDINGAPRD